MSVCIDALLVLQKMMYSDVAKFNIVHHHSRPWCRVISVSLSMSKLKSCTFLNALLCV